MSAAPLNQLHQARQIRNHAKFNRDIQTAKARQQRHSSEVETNNKNAAYARQIKLLKTQIAQCKAQLLKKKRLITRLQNQISKLTNGTEVASNMELNTAIAVVNDTIDKFVPVCVISELFI